MAKANKLIETVACFGSADCKPGEQLYKDAFAVGKILAQAGYKVTNGGGPGIMKAVTEGAHAGGGKVTGVTYVPKDVTHFEGKDVSNPVDQEIPRENYLERTLALLEVAQCYVIFKGGTGTIAEFGMAWGVARLYFGHHKPLILYGKFWENIITAFMANMRMRPEELQVYRIVDSPEEVVAAINLFEETIRHDVRNGHIFNPAERAFQI